MVGTHRAAIALAALLGSASLWAHAHLESAQPPVDGSIAQAPERVQIHFTERLEPALAALSVKNAAGEAVDDGQPQVSSDDTRILSIGLRQPLPAGAYTVEWAITSVDTHRTKGQYRFTVTP
ncbi:copper resistance protein CopC [Corticibacter populi]|uniref:Copper resistance protein CopC n=1 Tax=Corticibacter populi TaxID=1550736 RepID=A0A3M6QXN0_9BURK|nr:copper homeostasis periplasmic binding protein CopC [Corticibacter populi]RMX07734.1 copper resistance protein CopC [Corticibacter populi]RZS34952.1 hypothetical protein EV687_0003 [Corticibacter populi]